MPKYTAKTRFVDAGAAVSIGKTQFHVSAGTDPDRRNTCPVELILAGLGS